MSEKALVDEEKQQKKRTREMAGLSTSSDFDHDRLKPELPPTIFNPGLAVGEGHRTLSWIWYSTGSGEMVGDTTASRIGSCKFISFICK